ncbi:MAG: DegT/DnrJ/EryC1/StrS family aminotransferase [Terriglobia bacterium]
MLAVQKVLQSGHLREGRVTADFESRFARAVGARFAVAVNSGTAALFLAYRVMLKPGDEVIVPDFTFAATAAMVTAAGATPVFADVDPKTFTVDPASVERKLTRRTRAIVPVHLFGHPANVTRLMAIARRHHLRVIWDSAQAHGAHFAGLDVGSYPDVACYSFYPTKNMTTGEGGMLTMQDPSLAAELRLLRSHGEESRYTHVRIGFNFRMTDVAAALGRTQLAKLPAVVRRRRRNATILTRGLRGVPGLHTPHVAPGVTSAFNLFTVRIEPEEMGMSRDEFQLALAKRGVETAVHYPLPLHRQPIFSGQGSDGEFPVSTRLAQTVLSLPVHPGLTRENLTRIVRAVRAVARS